MKVLFLTIMREYFDAILSGEKTEEYRAASPYWMNRLKSEANPRHPLTFTHVTFRNGYNPDSPTLTVQLEDIRLMSFPVPKGKSEKLFVLFLGKLVKTGHLKPDQKRFLKQRQT